MRSMGISSQIRRYVTGIIFLVLIVSVGLNLYDHFVTLPQMEATTNNLRVEALEGWLHKMELVKNLLKRAETNFDVEDVGIHTSWAKMFVDVFTSGIDIFEHQKEFYYWVDKTTYYLQEALFQIYRGNQTGFVTERNLDQNILAMIANVTDAIENIESKTHTLSLNGVDPAQQLREAGVLTDVLNHLEEIYEISVDMYDYYR